MNLWIEEELPLILLKEYELNSHTKGYHTDMMKFLKAGLEPENEFDKFVVAVKKSILWLDIYQKEKLGNSQKLFHFFFVEAKNILAKLKLLEKEGTLALGIKTPYTL